MHNKFTSEHQALAASDPHRATSLPAKAIKALAWVLLCLPISNASAQFGVNLSQEMVLDTGALVLATGGNFSNLINGSPYQQEVLLTHEGYQYASWYHNGDEQDIFISRRDLTGNVWETIDTGYDMENGNQNWDSHNVISMGISGDGRIHLAYDHHVHDLRYLTTAAGVATSSGGTWNSAVFNTERNSLNAGGSSLPPRITYPRFSNVGDDLVLTYRDFGSGSGDQRIADYNSDTGQWSGTRFVTKGRGTNQTYDDAVNNPSNNRNSYHNGFHADSTGRLHTTWNWRESTQDGNHDINYAYSDDKGVTWRNTDDQLVGTNSSPITLNSDVEVVDLDRRAALLNQQGQIVDAQGGVHALMFHRPEGHTFTNAAFSDRSNSDYHHYYRDPSTGDWETNVFPSGIDVGSRPRLGVDSSGNLYGLYTHNRDLVIAGAQKVGGEYADWEVLHRDNSRDYDGTPQLDTKRLLEDGVLSIYIQDRATSTSPTEPTGSTLRVLEFDTVTPAIESTVSLTTDGSLRFNKTNQQVDGQDLGFVVNADELNIGQSGTVPYDRAAVMVFQIPDFGNIENPFQVANLQSYLTQSVTSGGIGGDLYGIDRRELPEILDSDYFGLTSGPDPDAVLLQDDYLVEGMAINSSVFTSAVGGSNLVDFLNEQYESGQGIGEYVFLRLNVDAETTQRWSIASGDATDEAQRPQLVYEGTDGPPFLIGDFDRDGDIDIDDVDFYSGKIGLTIADDGFDADLDLDKDDKITLTDHELHITVLLEDANGMGALIGDLNLDGDVDISQFDPVTFTNVGDASILLANLGQTTGKLYADGDLNADGDVDISQFDPVTFTNVGDASILLANLGQSTASSSSATSAVPEPSSMAVLAMAGIAAALRRRNR